MQTIPKDEKKILIKLSGGALSNGVEKYTESVLEETARQIKEVQDAGYEVALVVGGGNLFRGADLSGDIGVRRVTGDYVGMLAAAQNALVLRDYLEYSGLNAHILSVLSIPQVFDSYLPKKAREYLESGHIIISAGGIGPFFTTDSVAAQRALELNCGTLVLAKDGVDGVYTADPDDDPSATKIDTITASEVIERGLKVADASAIAMCRDNDLPIRVVSMQDISKLSDTTLGTIIQPE